VELEAGAMPENRQQVTFKVMFDDPRESAVPLFSNHVGISRAGTEVQFEFVFLDINAVASFLQTMKQESDSGQSSTTSPVEITGRSVAKIVMPLHVFWQLREHLQGMFAKIEQDLQTAQQEEANESSNSIRNVQVV
jgi:hypothetical protein